MKKDYNNMTQVELDLELSEIVRKNYEKGVVLLDRDYNFISFQKLSRIEYIEDIDNIIAILRSMKHSPNLKLYCKGMTDKEPLIHPVAKDAWKEPVYEDFVSREEFINRTGIFVTSGHFSYIYNMEWKKAEEVGFSIDDFINNYEDNSDSVMEIPLRGTFKYIVTDQKLSGIRDCDGIYEPNIWKLINSLARTLAYEQLNGVNAPSTKFANQTANI